MSYFWAETGQSLIAYRVFQDVALALGDPIRPEEEAPSILQAFLEFCQQQGWQDPAKVEHAAVSKERGAR